jgi:hypothetical protein
VDESLVILSPSGKRRTLVKRLLIPVESAEPPHEGDPTDFFKVLA